MPKASASVTKLVPRSRKRFVAGLILIFVILFPSGLLFFKSNSQKSHFVYVNNHKILVDVANTQQLQENGLSGRSGLAKGHGMLFVFGQSAKQCFWMKDMRFNIDILWFDDSKQLIYQKLDVSPSTYPDSFCSSQKAKYVLELPAGTSYDLGLGQNVRLDTVNL